MRLIDLDGAQAGIVSLMEALRQAEAVSMDLVEISPNAAPPVCRIMDYGKFQFQQSKQRQVAKKNQKQMEIREIKLRPGTDVGDYQVKLRKLIEFLEEGDKAKITLRFRGRELSHQELGVEMMERLKTDLAEYGVVEFQPRFEGKQMIMILSPKKKK